MVLPSLVERHRDLLVCPACGSELHPSAGDLVCSGARCGRAYATEGGIPILFWPNEDWEPGVDVTETIRAFYEETPFPNYDGLDSRWTLKEKAARGVFARLLDEQIPRRARVLEAGCGTGQLANFLALEGRTVFGTDLCLNSLRLAEDFRSKNEIEDVAFCQMNLFRPAFRRESFDLVISNGVLHHTGDPYRGFRSILALVRGGGYIIVGLYNTWGRLTTDLRRWIFRVTGDQFRFLDSRLRRGVVGPAQSRAWFMDQYKNPHESKHSIGEVLRWFDESGVEFVSGIPKPLAFEPFSGNESLFVPTERGTALDHAIVQLGILARGAREGGFFTLIGRKRKARQD